jgi:hypothetical protein
MKTTRQSVCELLRQHILAVPGPNKCAIILDADRLEADLAALLVKAKIEAVQAAREAAKAKRLQKKEMSAEGAGG